MLHEGPVVTLVERLVTAPDGERFEREVVRHPGAVSVVAVDDEDRAVVIRQFRAPIGAELLEIPAGKRDIEGEPPEVTAARELQEEVGLAPDHLELLGRFYNSPGFSDELSHVYLARGLRPVEVDHDGPEERHLRIERVPLASVPDLVAAGELIDAKSIIGLVLAREHLQV